MSKAFEEYVVQHVREYLPEDYEGAEICVDEMVRHNDEHQHSLRVVRPGDRGSFHCYLGEYEQRMRDEGMTMPEIMVEIAQFVSSYKEDVQAPADFDGVMSYEWCRPRLRIRLYDAELNTDYLEDKAYTLHTGFAANYRVQMSPGTDPFLSVPVTKEMVGMWGVTLEQLHADTVENENATNPARLVSSTRASVLGPKNVPNLLEDHGRRHVRLDADIYALTSEFGVNGASVIVRDGVLERVARLFGGSYYLVPDCIHQFFVIADRHCAGPEYLEKQLRGANGTTCPPEEVLSYHIYHYDKARKKLVRLPSRKLQVPLS